MNTALSAFIAAILGAFFGVYFKEYLSDRFNKKRKQKEIRISLIENLTVFFGSLKRFASNKNMLELEQAKYNDLSQRKENVKPEKLDIYGAELKGRFEYLNRLALVNSDDFNQLNELEGKITALIVEAEHYFETHKHRQLHKTFKEILNQESLTVIEFHKMRIEELEIYFKEHYRDAVKKKIDWLNEQKESTIKRVAEILK